MSIADRVVVMNKGRIEDMGPPSRVYLRPASLFTATFMGESNILTGEVVEATSGVAWVKTRVGTLTVPTQAAIGESVTLSIRPEQLLIGGAGEGCSGDRERAYQRDLVPGHASARPRRHGNQRRQRIAAARAGDGASVRRQ